MSECGHLEPGSRSLRAGGAGGDGAIIVKFYAQRDFNPFYGIHEKEAELTVKQVVLPHLLKSGAGHKFHSDKKPSPAVEGINGFQP